MDEQFVPVTEKGKLAVRVGDAETTPPPSHFKPREFFGSEENIEPDMALINPTLVENLNKLRELAGAPVTITSGFRSSTHSAERHKAKPGQHAQGTAADIKIQGLSIPETLNLLEQIPAFQKGGVGIYPQDGHVHVDVRGTRARFGFVNGHQITLEEALQYLPVDTSKVEGAEALSTETSETQLMTAEKEAGMPVENIQEQTSGFLDQLAYPGLRTRSELGRMMGRMGLTRAGITVDDIPEEIETKQLMNILFNYSPEAFSIKPFTPDPGQPWLPQAMEFVIGIPEAFSMWKNAAQTELAMDIATDPLNLLFMGSLSRLRSFLGGSKFAKDVERAQKIAAKIEKDSPGTSVRAVSKRYQDTLARLKVRDPDVELRANQLLNNDPSYFDKMRHLDINKTLNDEEIVAAGMLAAEQADDIMRFVTKLGPDSFFDTKLQKQLVDKLADLAALSAPKKAAESAVGAALEITQASPNKVRSQFTQQFTGLFAKGIVNPVTAAKQIMNFKSQADLAIFAKQLSRPGWQQMYNELLINGLLSGPLTLMGLNPVGNTMAYMMHLGNRQVAGLFGPGGVPPGEAGRMAMASLQAVPAALGVFWRTMKGGRNFLNEQVRGREVKIDLNQFAAITSENFPNAPMWMKPGIDWVASILRMPSRTMMSQDEFLKSIFYQGELVAQAGRIAAQGEDYTTLSRRAQRIRRAEVLNDIKINPSQYGDAHKAARHTALENTFTSPLGKTGEAMTDIVNNSAFLKMIFPFVRTPINIMKRIGNDLPFGLGAPHKLKAALQSSNKAIRDEAKGRLMFSSLLATTMMSATMNGLIVGGRGPSDPKLRKTARTLQDKVQGSIAFDTDGDGHAYQFLPLNTRTPVGQLLNLIGSVTEGWAFIQEQDPEAGEKFTQEVVLALFDLLEEAPFLDSIASVFEMQRRFEQEGLKGVEDHIKRTAPTYILPVFSSLRRQLRQGADPIRRVPGPLDKAETYWDGLANQVPGWSESVMPEHDMFGNEETYPIGYGPELVQNNAFGRMATLFVPGLNMIKEGRDIPKDELTISQWMIDHEFVPQAPRKTITGIEIPHNLYQQWKVDAGNGTFTGQSMSQRLMEVVNNPDNELVLQPNGESLTQDTILFRNEYNQQYRETLEMLMLTPEWAQIAAEIDNLELQDPDIEQSTNRLQRRTSGIKLLR